MNDRLLTVECLSHSAAVTSQLEHEEAEVWDQDVALTNDQLGQKIDKSDKAIGKLAERIAAVEGKFSAPQKQSHPGIVALWGLAGAVVLAFWGWMANGVVTQGNRLTGIETTLRLIQVAQAPKRVLQEIAKLDKSAFAQNLPALRKVAERKPIDVTPSLEEIHEVADKLQDVSVGTPEYWPTVLQFLTFATAAIAPTNVPPSTNSTVILSNDHIERLTFKNQIVLLDGGSFINTRFENSRIIFTENPVEMKNVQFINCVFEFPVVQNPSPYLKKASQQLLASNLTAFSPSLP